jgi:hypothetical protein
MKYNKMFDLKYYNDNKKQDIWFDELKGKQLSRQYLANMLSNKHILQKRINELPDYVDFKSSVSILHSVQGQNGLKKYKKFNEI